MTINYKTIRTIEFLENYYRQDIEENIKDYKELLNVLFEIQGYISEAKVQFPIWKLALDTMIAKIALHCYSFVQLISGQTIDIDYLKNKNKNNNIIDIPSAYVLLRAQLENFLMIDFIYFQPQSEDESKFRYTCWDYSSLISISKYKTHGKSKLAEAIKENEQEIIDLWSEIEKSSYLKKLTKNQRKRLQKNGDSRLSNSWDDLINLSKLNPLLFGNLYSLLSKHAHSESFGVFHLKGLKLGFHKNHNQAYLILFLSKSLICLLILRLTRYIKTAEIKFNMISPKLRNDIEIYSTFIDKELLKTST